MTALPKSEIPQLWNAIRLEEDLVKLVRRMPDEDDWMSTIPKELRSADPLRRSFGKGRRAPRRRDGRIGLDLMDDWRPGIFVGVLVDGRDHRIRRSSEPEKGPDFCLILDMHRDLHSRYSTDPTYGDFKGNLRRRCQGTRWHFLDHAKEHRSPNLWHPIHIRRPLVDVMNGYDESGDEQLSALRAAAGEVLNLVVGQDGDFWNLQQSLRRQLDSASVISSDPGGSIGVAKGPKGERPL